jgi:hypothetical protein
VTLTLVCSEFTCAVRTLLEMTVKSAERFLIFFELYMNKYMYVLRVLVYPDLCACMYSEYICTFIFFYFFFTYKCYLNNIIQNKNIAIEELCRKWKFEGWLVFV